jgi:NADH-quinone oxidoreductase subunit N
VNPLLDQNWVAAIKSSLELAIPEIILVGVACLLLTVGLLSRSRTLALLLAVVGVVGAAAASVVFDSADSTLGESVRGPLGAYYPILPGAFASYVRWLVLGVGFLLVWLSTKEAQSEVAADYSACLLIALAGTSLVARANDLVVLYLALEMISVPTYVLLYLGHRGQAGQEAATKYFLLSVLSSAILLFGLSYLFGLAGSTNITAITHALTIANKATISPMAAIAIVLTIAGLCFRITAVPFHYYAPDVYQGGPTSVVAQLAVMPKIAGLVALTRLLGMTNLPSVDLPFANETQIPLLLAILALVTMTLGNVMALLQDNIKRVLAYSGIAHAGYMLLGVVTLSAYAPAELGLAPRYFNGLDAMLFYLVGYVLMTLGLFAVLAHISTNEHSAESLDDLAGLYQSHPVATMVLFVSVLSLIGIPLTAGFNGKLFLFIGLYDSPETSGLGSWYKTMTMIAAINAAIGAVYYLRILGVVFLRSPLRPVERTGLSGPMVAGVLCALGTLFVGIYPQLVWQKAQQAAPTAKVVAPPR